ncbi:MAG TPA: dihydroorotate dehydrogenase [Candidatus Limnocylindria bacterium]|jgi:dihydroorotate dehydrogenase (NAD+) catalytic subunit|nr:dihydroorotate dehydrogenase [Candidatus Limnocylindria bacterium]
MSERTRVSIGSLELANPVMPASGCFGPELGQLIDLNRIGALVTKTVFHGRRSGNPAHRLSETYGGMLNSVGIPSPGVEAFLDEVLPRYTAWEPPTIVSLGGLTVSEYFDIAEALAEVPQIDAFEINISCPNLEAGGLEIGAVPATVEEVVRGVVDRTTKPVIAKLTPNVTSIAEIARAAEAGGATAISAINAVMAMEIDLRTRRAEIGATTAGWSGPAIKPVALRMVWQAANAVSLPVIGIGGIATAEHALEFILAGASAIQIGSASFTHPDTLVRVVDGIEAWLEEHGVDRLTDLIGTVELGPAEHDLAGSAGY